MESVSSFVDRLSKLKKIKKNAAALLILYYLLVMLEVKDAYLIDHMAVDSMANLQDILSLIANYCEALIKLGNSISDNNPKILGEVTVVMLGDDVFLVNERRWMEKMYSFPLRLISLQDSIKGSFLTVAEEEQMRRNIYTLAVDEPPITRGRRSMIRFIDQSSLVFRQIGAPLLAGFLLGYPYQYWAAFEGEGYQQGSNLLSFTTLRKTSLVLHKQGGTGRRIIDDLMTFLRIERCCITEFTVPESLVNEEVEKTVREWSEERSRRFEEMNERLLIADQVQLISVSESLQTETISL